MGSSELIECEGEEEQFYDSREDASSVFESCPASPARHEPVSDQGFLNWVSGVWVQNPESVQKRRDNFIKLMGLDLNRDLNLTSSESDKISSERECSSPSSPSLDSISTGISEENLQIKNLDNGTTFVVSELGTDGNLTSLLELGSNRKVSLSEFEQNFSSSSFIKQLMRRDYDGQQQEKVVKNRVKSKRRVSWLKRLGVRACIIDREGGGDDVASSSSSDCDQSTSGRFVKRVKVRAYKKRSKELSAVFKGQVIKAHDGAILTVRFSPDGRYLATGGEDGAVRVWRVMDYENKGDFFQFSRDDSSVYFRVNGNSELEPLDGEEKKEKSRSKSGNSDSACVVVPPIVFRLADEPVSEFLGHSGEVLDLSWSNNKYILSSSTDKTVRLWQLGYDGCLKIFEHRNYVTCVQFNPSDENYFISGSIDGKVRVWAITGCHVADWVDVKEIVTAVSYRPDGKGAVVGTISGICRFYDASENHLELDTQVSLNSKKKSPVKRITGFQYCPTDPKRLMVTSADSKIRILDGAEVTCKYKGIKSGNTTPVSASFTPDGRHIICSDEDSNIYLWDHLNPDPLTPLKTSHSFERFSSTNSSIAVPWNSMPPHRDPFADTSGSCYLSPSGSFTLNQEFLSESLPKNTIATWPEEKLPRGATTLNKSQCKVLKTACQNRSHAWGQVIVTAGWDGYLRPFQNYGLPVDL